MQGLQKRRHLDKLIFSLPFVFLLEVFWSIGEFVGYLTRKSASDREVPVQATT
jgi:hypothetical protein